MTPPARAGSLAALFRRRGGVIAAVVAVLAVATWVVASSVSGADQRPDRITVSTSTGDHVFTVEWALTNEERARGLMFREEMDPDHGMVFDFAREQPLAFWMKNTPLSLDMVFIRENGSVLKIAKGTTPFSEDAVPSGASARYVLEVVAGTSDRIGLEPGDTVDQH